MLLEVNEQVIGFTSGTFKKYQAEASGLIRPLDYITRVNGEDVIGKSYEEIVEMIVEAPRPLELTFARPMVCYERGELMVIE